MNFNYLAINFFSWPSQRATCIYVHMLWSKQIVPGYVFYTCGWIIHIHTYIIPTFLLLEPVIIIYHDYYHLS